MLFSRVGDFQVNVKRPLEHIRPFLIFEIKPESRQSCPVKFGDSENFERNCNVVDPDPYSGALWIRIRIPNMDPDPSMKIYDK